MIIIDSEIKNIELVSTFNTTSGSNKPAHITSHRFSYFGYLAVPKQIVGTSGPTPRMSIAIFQEMTIFCETELYAYPSCIYYQTKPMSTALFHSLRGFRYETPPTIRLEQSAPDSNN